MQESSINQWSRLQTFKLSPENDQYKLDFTFQIHLKLFRYQLVGHITLNQGNCSRKTFLDLSSPFQKHFFENICFHGYYPTRHRNHERQVCKQVRHSVFNLSKCQSQQQDHVIERQLEFDLQVLMQHLFFEFYARSVSSLEGLRQ